MAEWFDKITAWPNDFIWGGKENAPFQGARFDDDYEQAMVDALKDAQEQYTQYRPEIAGARIDGLNQALGMFGPANAQLQAMYGPQAGVDLSVESPLDGLFAKQQTRAAGKEPIAPSDSSTNRLQQGGRR